MIRINCPICNSNTSFFAEKIDRFKQKYEYFKCSKCKFLFVKDLVIDKDNLQKQIKNIYQEDYFQEIDTGWQFRGDVVSKKINKFLKIYHIIKPLKRNISVLDYGGGNGYIASKINNNFNVFYYDKYIKPSYNGFYKILDKPVKSDIVYAIELVEHITDFNEWSNVAKLSSNAFIFSTELSDGIKNKELNDWWYLDPDAGHTAIYSSKALYLLAKKYGFAYFFFPSKSFHIFLRSSFLSQFNFIKLEYPIYNFFRKIKRVLI